MSVGFESRYKTLTDIIKNFSPAWFSAIMGTGVISMLFHNFPYGTETLTIKIFTFIFFFLNLTLFVIFTFISLARYTLYPEIWNKMMVHPVQNLYLGCYPMGLTTIINVAVGLLYQDYGFGGTAFLYFLWGVWWADVAMSFLCCWPGVHHMKTRQKHSLDESTTIWLLPVVTLIVASSSGGVLSTALLEVSPNHALVTITFCVFMVTVGLSLALMFTVLYFARLLIYGMPTGPMICSIWINLGPAGQAGYSILEIGSVYKSLLPLSYGKSPVLQAGTTGDTINVICICISFMLWAFGTMWLFYCLLAIFDLSKAPQFGFQVSFWGMIFPNGVYANLTIQIYRTLDSGFFRVYGTIYVLFTMLMWIGVAIGTVIYMRHFQILLQDTGLGLVQYELKTRIKKGSSQMSSWSSSPAEVSVDRRTSTIGKTGAAPNENV